MNCPKQTVWKRFQWQIVLKSGVSETYTTRATLKQKNAVAGSTSLAQMFFNIPFSVM